MNIAVNFSDDIRARDDHDNGDDDDDDDDDDIDSDDDDADIFNNWFYWSSCRLSVCNMASHELWIFSQLWCDFVSIEKKYIPCLIP